jgi:hypothetical protein
LAHRNGLRKFWEKDYVLSVYPNAVWVGLQEEFAAATVVCRGLFAVGEGFD